MPIFGQFNRPVGAAVDVRELEYISALHQTDLPRLRRNGTIKAVDILIFLRSRWGLTIELGQALDILLALGGDTLEDEVDSGKLNVEAMEVRDRERKEQAQKERLEPDDELNPTLESHVRRRAKEEQAAAEEGHTPEKMAEDMTASKIKRKQKDDEIAAAADGTYLDLVQLLSIIIMPTLARSGKEWVDRNIHDIDPGYMPVDKEIKSSKWTLSYLMEKRRIKQKKEDVERRQSLRPKPENIIGDVHKILMASIEDDEFDRAEAARLGGVNFHSSLAQDGGVGLPVLNEKLVQRLLEIYCEYERAAEPDLIKEMVRMAVGDRGNGAEEPVFTEEAFVRALTADMGPWQVGCEDHMSGVFADVLGFDSYKEYEEIRIEQYGDVHTGKGVQPSESGGDLELGQSGTGGNESVGVRVELIGTEEKGGEGASCEPESTEMVADEATRIRRLPMAAHIDYVADVPRYLTYTVVLWVFFVTTALCYMTLFQSLPIVRGGACRGSEFGCTLASTIWSWLTLAVGLVLAGYLIMVPIALANNPTVRSIKVTVFCFLLTAAYTTVPYAYVYKWSQTNEPPYQNAAWFSRQWWFLAFMRMTLCMGIALSLFLAFELPLNTMTGIKMSKDGNIHRWMVAQNVRSCYQVKMAGSRKVNSFLTNAQALHPMEAGEGGSVWIGGKKQSQSERAMSNFVLFGEREMGSGGFAWTWRRLINRSLFNIEGIWLHSRLFIGQAAQVIMSVFVLGFFWAGTPRVADASQQARDDLIEEFGDDLPQWIYDFIPTREQVLYALYPAASVATLVALVLIMLYVPSTVSTILQLRCGKIPSLHDSAFVKYRMASDSIYLNVGNMIYALIGSVFLFFILIAVFIFLIIWPATWPFMRLLFAWGLGLIITILLKTICIKICRTNFHQAFYRKRPAAANFASLALECWHIGLGGGVMVARWTQFILAGIFWVGRIDVPFLSPDVNIAGFGFDLVPTSYRKDILVHDAHRHPFIDRLGAMYAMRLVHGNKFSSRAGACWRNLFVVALFPWMIKHRVFQSKVDQGISQELEQTTQDVGGSSTRVEDESEGAKTLGDRVIDTAWNNIRGGLKDGVVTAAIQVVDEWPSKKKKEG